MKAGRLAFLVSVQLCWLPLASARALAGNALDAWSDLWRTPDQQGQALLDAGEPAAAAARFHDPRRRAYAELQAGRDGAAAKLLEPFTDARSEYNRGNALAIAGQLQPALAAYESALKQSPADKDIRHNRDLVARALRQQQQSSRSSPRNGGQNGRTPGSSGQKQAGGGQQNGSGSQQPGAHGQQSAGQAAPNGSQPGGDLADNAGRQQPGQAGADTARETPDQAQRDAAAAAALARRQQQLAKSGSSAQAAAAAQASASRSGSKDVGKGAEAPGMRTPREQPENERQLALDQWLRQIPDSPAGLLQRKFLIEHMVKQQDGDAEPQGSGP
jgi:Ca-activated chloride channel family protein